MASSARLLSVDYEVFGRVQGVFFRKYTQKTAKQLGLVGWVQNASSGTVVGCVQGPEDKVATMMNWLQKEGSPKSFISKVEFKNEKAIGQVSFNDFDIVKPKSSKTRKKQTGPKKTC